MQLNISNYQKLNTYLIEIYEKYLKIMILKKERIKINTFKAFYTILTSERT